MTTLRAAKAARTPALSSDWVGVAVRPGSGIGLVPALLSTQAPALLLALVLAGFAAALAPWLERRLPLLR